MTMARTGWMAKSQPTALRQARLPQPRAASFQFAAEVTNGQLAIVLQTPNGMMPFVFSRVAGGGPSGAMGGIEGLAKPPVQTTPPAGGDLSGNWYTQSDQGRTDAVLQQQGNVLTALLTEPGASYQLRVERSGQGTWNGFINMGQQQFMANVTETGDGFRLTITGPGGVLNFDFVRSDAAPIHNQQPLPPPQPAVADLSGVWHNDDQGIRTTVDITINGNQLNAQVSEQGVVMPIQATLNAQGEYTGQLTIQGQAVPVVLAPEGATFLMTITVPAGAQQYRFQRDGAAPVGQAPQPQPGPTGSGFGGTWIYQDATSRSVATLSVSGATVSGTVSDGTNTMQVTAQINDNTATGTLTVSGHPIPLTMTVDGDQLTATAT